MKNTQVFWSLCLWVACLGLQCKPEPPDEPNPCLQQSPTTAAFSIHETWWTQPDNWPAYDTDTLVTIAATFTAQESGPGVEYEWILGAETLHVRSFYRKDFPLNQPISVRLKVRKTPNWNCFPTDDGVDEKTRIFYVKNLRNNTMYTSLVYGRYRGVNLSNPYDTFTLEIDTHAVQGSKIGNPEIRGLQPGCTVVFDGFSIGYRQVYFGNNYAPDCYRPMGIARVSGAAHEKLTFYYSRQLKAGADHVEPRINDLFTGTRIP